MSVKRDDDHVKGFCPMGCGPTLYLASGGYVECYVPTCPDSNAASSILEDPETEHVAVFTLTGFTIRHPLKERLGDALLTCDLQKLLSDLGTPPQVMGRYRALKMPGDDHWHMERLGP